MCAGMHRCACAWVCVCYVSKCVDVIEYVYVRVSVCVPLQEKKVSGRQHETIWSATIFHVLLHPCFGKT